MSKTIKEENQHESAPVEIARDSVVNEFSGKDLDLNHGLIQSPAVKGAWAKKLNFSITLTSQ